MSYFRRYLDGYTISTILKFQSNLTLRLEIYTTYCIMLMHRPLCRNFWCRHAVNTNSTIILKNKWICKNFFNTNIMYLKASTGIKISPLLKKNGIRLLITKWVFNKVNICGEIKQNESELMHIIFLVFCLMLCSIQRATFCRKPH